MRKISARLLRVSAALLSLALTACFDIREEVWIRPDGSGRAELRYTVPEAATVLSGGAPGIERRIRGLIESQPPLKLGKLEVVPENGELKIAVDVSTDSMLSLVDLKASDRMEDLPEAATDIMGQFDVRIHGLDIDFSRTVRVGEALGLASLAIPGEEKELRRISYIIHLPEPPEDDNADRTANDGRTLIWESSLGDALKRPLVTRFRARMPLPRWIVPTACGLAFLLALSALRMWRRLRGTL